MVFSQQQVIAMQVHVPANAKQFQQDASPAQNHAATILNECSIFPGNNLNFAQMHQIQPSAIQQITSSTTTTPTKTTTTTIKQTPSMLQYKGPFATYLLCIEKLTNQLFASSGANNSEICCTSFCKKAQDLFIGVANMKQGKHRNKKKTLLALCAASVYHYCKIHRSVSRTIKELLKLMNNCNGEQQKKNGAKSSKKQLSQKENNDNAEDEEEDGVHVQRKQFTHALKLIQQNLFGNGSAVLSKLEENKQAPLKTAAVSAASQVLTRRELEMLTRVSSQQEIVSTSSPEISSSEEDNHDEQMKHEYSPSFENGDDDEENEGTLIMKDDFKEEQVVPPVMVRSPPKQQQEQQAIPVATQCVDLLALANMAAAESIKIEQSTSSGEAITAQKIDFAKRTLANVFHDQTAAGASLYQFCLDKCIELFNKFPSRVARTITAVAIFITVQREQAKLQNKFTIGIPKQGLVEESAQIKGIPSLMLMTTAEMLEFATRTTDVNCLSVRSVLKELKVL